MPVSRAAQHAGTIPHLFASAKHQQCHALLHIQSQIQQSIAHTVRQFRDLGISIRGPFVVNSRFRSPPFDDIAIQEGSGDIKLLRYNHRGYGNGSHGTHLFSLL